MRGIDRVVELEVTARDMAEKMGLDNPGSSPHRRGGRSQPRPYPGAPPPAFPWGSPPPHGGGGGGTTHPPSSQEQNWQPPRQQQQEEQKELQVQPQQWQQEQQQQQQQQQLEHQGQPQQQQEQQQAQQQEQEQEGSPHDDSDYSHENEGGRDGNVPSAGAAVPVAPAAAVAAVAAAAAGEAEGTAAAAAAGVAAPPVAVLAPLSLPESAWVGASEVLLEHPQASGMRRENGNGGVEERKDGRWEGGQDVDAGVAGEAGVRVVETESTALRDEGTATAAVVGAAA